MIIRAGGHSTELAHYVCPSDYKTVDGDSKKNFATAMQISVKIMIRFDAGAERINIVRAFG